MVQDAAAAAAALTTLQLLAAAQAVPGGRGPARLDLGRVLERGDLRAGLFVVALAGRAVVAVEGARLAPAAAGAGEALERARADLALAFLALADAVLEAGVG